MDKVILSFEGLIRRGIAPSMTFVVVALAGDYLRFLLTGSSAWEQVSNYGERMPSGFLPASDAAFVTLAILAIIGSSYGLMALQQVLFDNTLRGNFEPWRRKADGIWASDVEALRCLRKKVSSRWEEEQLTSELSRLAPKRSQSATSGELTHSDYVLYEVIGGIDATDTRPFVDSAKALGIVFVSVMLVLLANTPALMEHFGPWVLGPMLLLTAFTYWGGREVTAAQYRARALRLYVNFLAMPPQRIKRILEGSPAPEARAPGSDRPSGDGAGRAPGPARYSAGNS